MAFKRAEWHSGLTYQQTCDGCNTIVQYDDTRLDFRPWYADGFVYCPKCKKPLRHREMYAIGGQQQQPETIILGGANPTAAPNAAPTAGAPSAEGFCSKCGREFRSGDVFCSGCGQKRS